MESLEFILKKTVSALFYPVGISLLLLLVGLATCKLKRSSRFGIPLIAVGILVLLLLSFPITAFLLLRSLETRAASYADPNIMQAKGVRYIVVLGGSGKTTTLTPADRTGASIFRVLEGVRLWHLIPGSTLVMSGMGFPSEANTPDLMKALPMELGVPANALIAEAQAWDTGHEARLFARLVGSEYFALVTSAYHIPRAMKLFEMQGLKPIASPCEFKARIWPSWYRWFIPDAEALWDSQLVIHEYIGMLWLTLR